MILFIIIRNTNKQLLCKAMSGMSEVQAGNNCSTDLYVLDIKISITMCVQVGGWVCSTTYMLHMFCTLAQVYVQIKMTTDMLMQINYNIGMRMITSINHYVEW